MLILASINVKLKRWLLTRFVTPKQWDLHSTGSINSVVSTNIYLWPYGLRDTERCSTSQSAYCINTWRPDRSGRVFFLFPLVYSRKLFPSFFFYWLPDNTGCSQKFQRQFGCDVCSNFKLDNFKVLFFVLFFY